MLKVKECVGLKSILQKLSDYDLLSVVSTTTKGLIKVDESSTPASKAGNIDIILKYSEKSSTLLRRKKVKKEYIFQYLHDEGIVIPVSSDKSDSIKACLKYWDSEEHGQNLLLSDDLDDDITMEEVDNNAINESSTAIIIHENVSLMGQSFISWFYSLLRDGKAGAEHFWPDASLGLQIEDTEQKKVGSFTTAEDVSHFLKNICNHVLLHPNGLLARSHTDSYGTVTVEVSGVIHRSATCMGLFDQIFGLVRHPSEENRWMIKFTKLKMKINCMLINQMLCFHQLKSS